MILRMILRLTILACAVMTISACVLEPYNGERGYYYGDNSYYGGDYGHRVWRE
jgi:hypothetical protein